MPPKKKRIANSTSTAPMSRRSLRQSVRTNNAPHSNGIPNVYQEMLDEAAADDSDGFPASPGPTKRQKVDMITTPEVDELFDWPPPTRQAESEGLQDIIVPLARPQQVIYDDFEGSSDDSDVEFEDIELDPGAPVVTEDKSAEPKSLQIDLSKSALEPARTPIRRRKTVTKAERAIRLDVHKWHLLSLIGHGLHRNDWCNHDEVHDILKPLVPRKLIKLLHVDESKPQYERNYSFNKGVEEICLLWHNLWKTTVHGLRKAHWREGIDARTESDEGEDLDFDDFQDAARTCRGSRDLGAQLFTALLRSIAVDARLVFSLQVLPFTGAARAETPVKSKSGSNSSYIYAPAQNYGASPSSTSPFTRTPVRPKKSKKIIDSPYPIFWTEILTPAGTWTPLDPIVRNTTSKPKTQFEPSLSDDLNSMTYVIAYEDDNSAHDVTRRYTQWYNAKTRKMRVESTKHGEEWYSSALSVLAKKLREPRDEMEDDELAKRANSEGMPHNIQDFKNHPVYVLERHMRANEVLQPKREVGKVNVGTAKNGKIESVYRRQDVHLCRTADAWYQRGRDVRVGEQPLKRAIPKTRRRVPSMELSDDENEDESDGVGLYAEFQTSVYEPPPVVDGRIPKNAYGNLEVYVPSMIPPGSVHVSHPLAAAAARLLAVDFADAVTGFEFKGRQGTAVINGVVVGLQYAAAVAAVIGGLEALGSEEAQEARSRIVLGIWKRMLQALRVRERIEAEYGTNGRGKKQKMREDDSDNEESTYEESDLDAKPNDEGGGFMLEAEQTEEKVQDQTVNLQIMTAKMPAVLPEELISVPIKITLSPHKLPNKDDANDDLFEDDDSNNDANDIEMAGDLITDNDIDTGGGFTVDNAAAVAGGFLPDDDAGGGFTPDSTMSPAPKASTNGSIPIDPDTLYSDAEEDTALQLAIAESLVSQPTPQPQEVERESKPGRDLAAATSGKEVADTSTSTDGSGGDADSGSPTSLISHDPNEDDEEPDWVNEALDE